ncbi:MAG: ribulose-5-phosphate 4-epimerase/fuculose-1-phosphate aldolase [Saprospiraceae bacterium]|jgi:ribulose-5-phosphate 4-epimerase/fuculose-1-phosphate aldolase
MQSTVVSHHSATSTEDSLRINMAAGFRWLDKMGMSDLTAGSIVARVTETCNELLTHPHDYYFDEICAHDIVKTDFQANVVDGSNRRVNFAAVNPAASIFQARPDVNVVIHAHAHAIMAVSGLETGLQLVSEPAFAFYKGLSYLDPDFHFDDDYCAEVVTALGDGKALIYRNHSFSTVGKTVAEAVLNAYLLDQACEIQLRMQASGEKIIRPTDTQLQHHYDAFYGNPRYVYDGSLEWAGMLRRLDREDRSYRN